MSATTKIAVGVASGYLLGRTKKLRLAITVGSMLAGQRVATNPQALLKQASGLIEKNPELLKLQEQITGKLVESAKNAAVAAATSRLESFNTSLKDRGNTVKGQVLDDQEDEPEDEAPEDEYEEEGEEPEESEEES